VAGAWFEPKKADMYAGRFRRGEGWNQLLWQTCGLESTGLDYRNSPLREKSASANADGIVVPLGDLPVVGLGKESFVAPGEDEERGSGPLRGRP